MARMSHCLEALGDTYPVFLGICMCVVVCVFIPIQAVMEISGSNELENEKIRK